MPSAEKQVRAFISSTFRDMHAERDHLVTIVFPELRERLEQLGLEFFDVDLRWGVPAKDADGETANSWEYCRQWIDRVEPFFVCILGQRYGWVPEPHQFREPTDQQRQEQEPRSITDLEVRHAVLDQRRKRRSYFYLRTTPVPEPNAEYVDPPEYQGRLEQLKTAVRRCERPVRDYQCRWMGQSFAEMEEFGRLVLGDLWSGVLRDELYVGKDVWRRVLGADPDHDPRYTDESVPVPEDIAAKIVALAKPPPEDPLDAERQQMDAFATSRLRWFQGRSRELQQLTDFLEFTATDAPRLAVVAAAPGQGKSALLAKFSTFIQVPSTFLITHYVGATERSATAHALVERLLGELDRSGIAWLMDEQKGGEEPKRDFNSLCLRLAKRLGEYAGERPVVILLDALNQLTDGHDLHWLPIRFGPSVRVIVSCIEDTAIKPESPEQRVLHALASRQLVPLRVPLEPLRESDVRTIVVEYLKEYCKELDREHVDTICRMEQARNPLYLLVMLGELRTLGGNDMNRIVGERIAALAHDYPDTVALFRRVLQRLEVFGAEAVQWWCLYLAHGRVGMASHEMADLLARKLGADGAATALRIERGLRRYLQRRGPQLDFFHGQLRQAVMEQYGSHAETATVHVDIATYFSSQDSFLELLEKQLTRAHGLPPTPRPANRRKVEELVYQRLCTLRVTPEKTPEYDQACEALEALLTELFFLEAKTEAGLVFELAHEFSEVVAILPESRPCRRILRLLEEGLRRNIHFLSRHPTALFQCMWNTCWWHDCPDAEKHYFDTRSPKGTVTIQAGKLSFDPSHDQSDLLALSPPWRRQGPKVSQLLEKWREEKLSAIPGVVWLRSLRPPATRLETGLIGLLTGHEGVVASVACSANGRFIASGSWDNSVRIWDQEFGEELRVLQGHTKKVLSVAFSPEGNLLASGSDDCTIRIWDPHSGRQILAIDTHDAAVLCVSFSRDGRLIAGGTLDNSLRLWQSTTGAEFAELRQHTEPVTCVTFAPNGIHLASGSMDKTIRIWDFCTGEQVKLLRGHNHCIKSLAYSPNAHNIVSVAHDNTVRLWDAIRGVEIDILYPDVGDTRRNRLLNCLALSPDGRLIALGTSDNLLRIQHLESGAILGKDRDHGFPVSSVAFSSNGQEVTTGSSNAVYLWRIRTLSHHEAFSKELADRTARRRDHVSPHHVRQVAECHLHIEDNADYQELRQHRNRIECICFSPDGTRVATSSRERTVRVWDANSGIEIVTLRDTGDRLQAAFDPFTSLKRLTFSPDGKQLIGYVTGNTAIAWDVQTGECSGIVQHSVDFSADIPGPTGLPFHLLVRGLETVVQRTSTEKVVAWFPTELTDIAVHPSIFAWAGANSNHLCIVKLEGNVELLCESERELQAQLHTNRKSWWKFW